MSENPLSAPIVQFQFKRQTAIDGQISLSLDGENLRLQTQVRIDGKEFDPAEGVSLPARKFRGVNGEIDIEKLESFCEGVLYVIGRTVDESLLHDLASHIHQTAHLVAVQLQFSDASFEQAFESLARDYSRMIKAKFNAMLGYQMEGAGRRAKWTREMLQISIMETMRKMKPKNRTYPLVAKAIRKKWPGRMSGEGPALKKLVKRYNLNWEELKTSANRLGTTASIITPK